MTSKNSPHLGPNPQNLLTREGFQLISTRRIALPVWRVGINSRLLNRKSVPAIDEFILRTIGLGVGTGEEICGLLNLPKEVTDAVVSTLVAERHIRVAVDGAGSTALELTPSGVRLTETLVDEKPVEKSVTFSVNGITGDPMTVRRSSLLSAKDLDDVPHLTIEPSEEVNLEFGPNDTPRFAAVLKSTGPRDTESLLSILETEATAKMYLSAIGLLFESVSHADDFYMRICIDGRAQDDLEETLRESQVLNDMRLDTRVAEDRRRVDRALGTRIKDERVSDSLLEGLRVDVVRLTGSSGSDDFDDFAASQSITSSVAERAQRRLLAVPVSRLRCTAAQESLQLALSTAKAEVLISSSRLWPQEGADEFLNLILQLLNASVDVIVEVAKDERQISNADKEQLKDLERACAGKRLTVWRTKMTHEANFVSVDGLVAYVFAGSPFVDIGISSERFGDDRPTLVAGTENVQEFLATVHGRSGIESIHPPAKGVER